MGKILKLFKISLVKKQLTIGLKVRAGAKENSIGEFIFVDDQAYLKISIKVAAQDGKANEMIVAYLSKQWKIPKNNIEIIKGAQNYLKIIALKNVEAEYLEKLLIEQIPIV